MEHNTSDRNEGVTITHSDHLCIDLADDALIQKKATPE